MLPLVTPPTVDRHQTHTRTPPIPMTGDSTWIGSSSATHSANRLPEVPVVDDTVPVLRRQPMCDPEGTIGPTTCHVIVHTVTTWPEGQTGRSFPCFGLRVP